MATKITEAAIVAIVFFYDAPCFKRVLISLEL